MLAMKSVMKIEIKGKEYQFSCDPDSPLNDALDANNQINAFLLGRIQQGQNGQSLPAVEEQPKSE